MSKTSPSSSSEGSNTTFVEQNELDVSNKSPSSSSEGSQTSQTTLVEQDWLVTPEKSPSSSSKGSDTIMGDQNEFDIYLQAVFGYLHPKRYDMITATMRVIEYSKDSFTFWSSFRHFIRFASEYQSLLNEDLVMVIQNGAYICDAIVSYLERTKLKYKYSVGPANCFVLTVMSGPHEITSFLVPQTLIDNSGLGGKRIMVGGSYEVSLRLHSMLEICTKVFSGKRKIGNAKRVVRKKDRDKLGIKLSDNCAFPSFLALICAIQGAPKIPTLMVETGMSDNTTKVEVDCISIILGVSFMVESVIGIDLRTNKKSRELISMQLIVFDVSLDAMVKLCEDLTENYEKALVSIVLKRKALAKRDEVRALLQLKECLEGNGNYKSVCDDIAKQYRLRMKNNRMRHMHKPKRPEKEYAMLVLNDFGFKNEALRLEETQYQGIIRQCDEELDMSGVQELLDDNIQKAEAFMMKKLYETRKVQTVTGKAQQNLILPSTALSSTHWWEQEQYEIVLPAEDLVRFFGHISFHCTQSNLEECVIKVATPKHYLKDGCYPTVALLNLPDGAPKRESIERLDRKYASDPRKPPVIKTQLMNWKTGAIQSQLRKWNVPDNGNRYHLMIKLLDKYTEYNKGISPPTPSTESPPSPKTLSNLRKGMKRTRSDSSNPSQKDLPDNVAECLATVRDSGKRVKIWELLSQEKYDSLLLEINDDSLSLKGLNLLFRLDEVIIGNVFSCHPVITQLRQLGSGVGQS